MIYQAEHHMNETTFRARAELISKRGQSTAPHGKRALPLAAMKARSGMGTKKSPAEVVSKPKANTAVKSLEFHYGTDALLLAEFVSVLSHAKKQAFLGLPA